MTILHALMLSIAASERGGPESRPLTRPIAGPTPRGKAMGDKKLQAEGKMDKAKGEARQALGDAKDAAKR